MKRPRTDRQLTTAAHKKYGHPTLKQAFQDNRLGMYYGSQTRTREALERMYSSAPPTLALESHATYSHPLETLERAYVDFRLDEFYSFDSKEYGELELIFRPHHGLVATNLIERFVNAAIPRHPAVKTMVSVIRELSPNPLLSLVACQVRWVQKLDSTAAATGFA